ncbi:phage distal tail protein domain-containing protein [Oenococcus alcoholitolerans]|uniref:phage distal tail protein domain-containing protein n=1 Tax=Oenococcus alcoholitolerans TaxID=931074 RepID=UPI003F705585
MFKLTNAHGETVDLNTDSLREYTPTGLGLAFSNQYSAYESYFIPTKQVLNQGIMQANIQFGDISSQSYQTFSQFAEFLSYQPLTLEYTTDAGTWYRDAQLQGMTKTEIGGSTVGAFDKLNEQFTIEFINNWYNNKTAEYKSYDPDPNLGTYGKIYSLNKPSTNPDRTINSVLIHDNQDGTNQLSTKISAPSSIVVVGNRNGNVYNKSNLGYANLILDSEMLNGLQPSSQLGWNAGGDSNTSIISGAGHNGKNALQIKKTSTSPSVAVSGNFDVKLGSTYYWSVWYKVTSALSQPANVYIEGRGGTVGHDTGSEKEDFVQTNTSTGNWIQIKGSYIPTSSSTNFLRLRFENLGTGTILFSEPMTNTGNQLNDYISDTVDPTKWSISIPSGDSYTMTINSNSFTFNALVTPDQYGRLANYVYIESTKNANEKSMLLVNDSNYFGMQKGSPCLIEIDGPVTNPSWSIVQNGIIIATDAFSLSLSNNQKLLVSSYPDDQYARVYNPDGSYSDVSQLQDFTKSNFVQIPQGESTALFYVGQQANINITFKEERLLV